MLQEGVVVDAVLKGSVVKEEEQVFSTITLIVLSISFFRQYPIHLIPSDCSALRSTLPHHTEKPRWTARCANVSVFGTSEL